MYVNLRKDLNTIYTGFGMKDSNQYKLSLYMVIAKMNGQKTGFSFLQKNIFEWESIGILSMVQKLRHPSIFTNSSPMNTQISESESTFLNKAIFMVLANTNWREI